MEYGRYEWDPDYSAYFIKPLKRKAIFNFFIGISLIGFYLIEFTILGLSFPASGTFLSGIELPKFLGVASLVMVDA